MNTRADQRQSDVQPEIEAWVTETCAGLGLPVKDSWSDFFASGATSMTAMRLIATAEEKFGQDTLPPEDLFECRSVREIAAVIQRNGVRGS
jgi:acyl carrier protein